MSSDTQQPPPIDFGGGTPEDQFPIVKPDDHEIRRVWTDEYRGRYAHIWGAWHTYNPETGIWEDGKKKVKREIENFMASARFKSLNVTNSRMKSVLEMAQNHMPEEDELPNYPYLIPLTNGVYDVRNQTFTDHSAGYYFGKSMGYAYEPKADCPKWLRMLAEILPYDDHGNPDIMTMNFLQEVAGYALYGDNRMQAAIFLWGEGGSGKSTVQLVIQKLCNSTATINLQTMSQNELAMLVGERLATFAEVDKGAVIPEAAFKRALSSDMVTAKLLYKDVFTFQPAFMLLGAMNHLPRIRDRSEAVYRRVHVIPFPHQVQNPDVNLIDKLEEELPGIFMWAMRGLERLLARGHFDPPPAVQQAKAAWRYRQDIERQFLDSDLVIKRADLRVQASVLYATYKQWRSDNGHPTQTMVSAAENWKRLGLYNKKIGGLSYWFGVGLASEHTDSEAPPTKPPTQNQLMKPNPEELL